MYVKFKTKLGKESQQLFDISHPLVRHEEPCLNSKNGRGKHCDPRSHSPVTSGKFLPDYKAVPI
jgi:hypothetical protein